MGVHGLAKLLADAAPASIKETKFGDYFGRKIAVDASISIVQFLVVVGRQGDQLLTSETGDVTSHLQGMFYRTSRMLEAGMKPVFVFEGKAPEMKKALLSKRREQQKEAAEGLEQAKETGQDEATVEKYSKRSVRMTHVHVEECQKLLQLMGVPILTAAGEAEAQCVELCKSGSVYAVASEDMDCLAFGAPRQIRHLMTPGQASLPVLEINLETAHSQLQLTQRQFVDMCLLCGTDYLHSLRGIGPVRALQLIQKHGSLDAALDSLDPVKFPRPEEYPYKEARQLFLEPAVVPSAEVPPLKWGPPDEEALVAYLVGEKQFAEERVRKAVARIRASKHKSNQGRLESFFGAPVKISSTPLTHKLDGKGAGSSKAGKAAPLGGVKKSPAALKASKGSSKAIGVGGGRGKGKGVSGKAAGKQTVGADKKRHADEQAVPTAAKRAEVEDSD